MNEKDKELNEIKFSHNYYKLPDSFHYGGYNEYYLLAVFRTKTFKLGKRFLDYNSIYGITENGLLLRSEVPDGDVLVLLFGSFFDECFELFSAIRKWTPQKEQYYRSKVGQKFKIVVEQEEAKGV
ncbi:MAG: hypothetical protein ACTSYD_02125 [Candidatus Heimdallarchaeaceae archaeon]